MRAGLATCVLALGLFGAAQETAEGVVVEVSPPFQEALSGAPIRLTVRVHNRGTRDILVNRRLYLRDSVWLEVTTPSGETADWCGPLVDRLRSQSDFAILLPTAEVENTIRVSCNKEEGTPGFVFDTPGEYLVKARYKVSDPANALVGFASGALVVRGPVEAEPVRVVVRSGGPTKD
jgi:hypothetical protein